LIIVYLVLLYEGDDQKMWSIQVLWLYAIHVLFYNYSNGFSR